LNLQIQPSAEQLGANLEIRRRERYNLSGNGINATNRTLSGHIN
jgi:hypothetical protein